MKWSLKARWNRVVSDARCAVGWALFHLAARITDASVHSYRGKDCSWDWKMLVKRAKD
jgi:hypothetical protein